MRNKSKSKKFVFIVGSGRSGTTLLRNILNLNELIGVTPELHLFDLLINRRIKFKSLSDRVNPDDIDYYLTKIKKFKKRGKDKENWDEIDINKKEFLQKLYESKNYYELLENILVNFSSKTNTEYILEKTPLNIFFLDQIARIFKECFVINIIRDGREVCASARKKGWSENIEHIMALWIESVMTSTKSVSLRGRFLSVKYEDLITDAENTVGKIFNFIGIDKPNEDFISEVNNLGNNSAFDKKSKRGLDVSKNFSNYFSHKEQLYIENILSKYLIKFGYLDKSKRNNISVGHLKTCKERVKIKMYVWLLKRSFKLLKLLRRLKKWIFSK